MKLIAIARTASLAALSGALMAGVAEARNPHCAGGIQYVVQAIRDKDKGNLEDYTREINKAVQQLEICQTEDPADFEAIGYLGWAYAEVESMGPAGKAFQTAIKGLEAKGDKKKGEQVLNNMNSFWARSFNDGIGKIQTAQTFYPEFCKTPENDADKTAKGEAEKHYADAELSLTRALLLKPGDPQSIRNLASVYALTCNYQKAEVVVRKGLEAAPADTALNTMLKMVRMNYANQLVDQKKFDEAIGYFGELIKADANNPDLHLALADVHFRRAQGATVDARKPDFIAAGEGYSKAFAARPTDADLSFNAGVAYQNAAQWDKAEAMWAKTVQIRPDDTDALSSWGAALVELKRCPDAIAHVHKAVGLKPKDKNLHRQLGAIYTKCGNNSRGTDEMMVFLAMQHGQPVADAAAQAKEAKQGTDAAKALASDGVPEDVYQWELDKQKVETWFYWSKKRAVAFIGGALSRRSDWTAADVKPAAKP